VLRTTDSHFPLGKFPLQGGASALPSPLKETRIPGDRPGEFNLIRERVSPVGKGCERINRRRSSPVAAEAAPAPRLRVARRRVGDYPPPGPPAPGSTPWLAGDA